MDINARLRALAKRSPTNEHAAKLEFCEYYYETDSPFYTVLLRVGDKYITRGHGFTREQALRAALDEAEGR